MTTNVTHNIKSAELAAIEFAIRAEEGLEFLRAWHEGSFDAIRREWPDAPEAVFIGADPMHKPRGEAPEQSEPVDIETLVSDAHYIFNNPPGEASQDVRDVIEWFAASLRVACTHPAPKAGPVNTALLKALQAALGWIDAVPDDVVLPTMPGFDRDDVDALVVVAKQAPQPKAEPVNQVYLDGGWHDKPAEDMWMYTTENGWASHDVRVVYPAPQPKAEPVNQMLLDALRKIATVNAMDYEYQRWARAALAAAEQAPQPAELTTYSTCNETLRSQGKPYPRTCAKCGLGQCVAAQGAMTK